ncbi:MAG: hypothetical protein ACOX5F_02175 [Anaerovoracaceae bacterium]|jgi:hypothetical protein
MAIFTYDVTKGDELIYQLQSKKYYSNRILQGSEPSQERGDPHE